MLSVGQRKCRGQMAYLSVRMENMAAPKVVIERLQAVSLPEVGWLVSLQAES